MKRATEKRAIEKSAIEKSAIQENAVENSIAKKPSLSSVLLAFRLLLPEAKDDILARWIGRFPEYKDELISSWLEWYDLRNQPAIANEQGSSSPANAGNNRLLNLLASNDKAQIGVFGHQVHQGSSFPDQLSDLIRIVRREEQGKALRRHNIHLVDSYKQEEIERVQTQTLEYRNWGRNKTEVSVILQRRYKNGENIIPPSQMDETLFILQRGRITMDCPGLEEPIEMETNKDQFSVCWMPAFIDDSGRRGLPKRTIVAEGDAVGLMLFYSRHGLAIDYNSTGTSDVELPVMEWKGKARRVDKHRTASIPRKREDLERYIRKNQISASVNEKHRHAVDENQIFYAELEDWRSQKSEVLRVRVMKFAPREENADKIWLDYHKGRELILPLQGRFTCLYGEVISDDYEQDSSRRYEDLNGRMSMSVRVSSNTVEAELTPEILLLNSSYFHGFFGNDSPAYVLHVRILAEPFGRGKEVSILEKSVSLPRKRG
jgi:hypothetical protein